MDSSPPVNPDPRRQLPRVDDLAGAAGAEDPGLPRWALVEAARRVLDEARSNAEGSKNANWVANVLDLARELAGPRPRRVLNATGVVLHTNLGRAPLASGAAQAAAEAASGWSDLELDLGTGRRGDRLGAVAEKLRILSGAEAAAAVNNNAAAVLLALDTLARGREVLVSRGELVEIGGSFRVPEIMAKAGVRLVEVGTTNRTHLRDYESAIGPDTALLLKVHRSNFALSGFVAEVGLPELVALGRRTGLAVVEDLGSGTLVDLRDRGFPDDSYAPARAAAGVDAVCFSGDKLLGGPQAGLILGRQAAVAAMRRNPLARALRLDKLSLAALDWTLSAMLEGSAESELPALRCLLEPADQLERRARGLSDQLAAVVRRLGAGLDVSAEADRAPVGGGSLPGFELDTWTVTLRGEPSAVPLAERLRRASCPVLSRVRDGACVLDCRTLTDEDCDVLAASLESALR